MSEKEFDQIVECEFLSGLTSSDLPEIPDQCQGCDVLSGFVSEIKRQQVSKEASIKLGALYMKGSPVGSEKDDEEGVPEQDEDIANFMMRVQDADIESDDNPEKDDEEDMPEQDEDIAIFMMHVQDAGIEGADNAMEGWKKAMQNTIDTCASGVATLEGDVDGVIHTKKICTSSMQIHDQCSEETEINEPTQIEHPPDQEN